MFIFHATTKAPKHNSIVVGSSLALSIITANSSCLFELIGTSQGSISDNIFGENKISPLSQSKT